MSSGARAVPAGQTLAASGRRATRAPAACSMRSVWSRLGAGSTTVVGPPFGIEPGQQHARLDLCARHRRLVADRLQRAALDPERCVAVRRRRPRRPSAAAGSATRSSGRRDSDSSPTSSKLALRAGEDAREQAHQRAGVPAVDRGVRAVRSPRSPTPPTRTTSSSSLDSRAERGDRCSRRQRVGGAPEPADLALAVGDRSAGSSARWEIDLSPGTRAGRPAQADGAGSNPHAAGRLGTGVIRPPRTPAATMTE